MFDTQEFLTFFSFRVVPRRAHTQTLYNWFLMFIWPSIFNFTDIDASDVFDVDLLMMTVDNGHR